MPNQLYALHLEGVSKAFGGIRAVNSVTMSVKPGERRALIGPNGAGKTTLFNLIAGVLPTDQGSITMFGEEVTRVSVRQRAQRGLGRTYQTAELFLELTVEENLFLAALGVGDTKPHLFRSWTNHRREREWTQQVADRIRLANRSDVPVSELSHGEQRQLEVGMALAMNPRLIMLDEPSSGLSPAERPVLTELLRDLPHDATVIIIEHDMEIALGLADSVTVLNQGRVITNGSPQEIRTDEQVRAIYLGTSHA